MTVLSEFCENRPKGKEEKPRKNNFQIGNQICKLWCGVTKCRFLINASLIYNVVLVSGVQKSDSIIYIYIYTLNTHTLFCMSVR